MFPVRFLRLDCLLKSFQIKAVGKRESITDKVERGGFYLNFRKEDILH